MAAVFDAVATGANGSQGGSLSWSHILGNVGPNGLIVVIAEGERLVSFSSDANISGITFNGVAMHLICEDIAASANTVRCSMYALWGVDVPAAGTYTVTVSYATNSVNSRVGGSISFSGVKAQTAEAVANTNANGTAPLSLAVTTVTNNALVIAGYASQNTPSATPTTGETVAFDRIVGSVEDSECFGGYKTVTPAGSTTTTLTLANPQSEVLLLASFAIAPITGGGIDTSYSFLM